MTGGSSDGHLTRLVPGDGWGRLLIPDRQQGGAGGHLTVRAGRSRVQGRVLEFLKRGRAEISIVASSVQKYQPYVLDLTLRFGRLIS